MDNLLNKIIVRQKTEWESKKSQTYIDRSRLQDIQKVLPDALIKVIIGPRRAGKSVLASLVLRNKKAAYFNFDELLTSEIDTEELMAGLHYVYGEFAFIFFDEIQNVKGWQFFLNRLQREGYNLVVTGSNANLLSGELATHLTGRHITIEVLPFSFFEFIQAKKSLHATESERELAMEYLRVGGYPEIVLSTIQDRSNYLRSLVNDVLYKDIVTRHGVRKVGELDGVTDWAFSNVAKEMSYVRLIEEEGNRGLPASPLTAKKYIGYLQDAYLLQLVSRYDHKHRERIKSPKKIYAVDNGATIATGFRTSPDDGHLLENAVHSELMKVRNGNDIYYYRSEQGNKEIDFVVKQGHKVKELIQVSWDISSIKTRNRELSAFEAASKETKCRKFTLVTSLAEETIAYGELQIRVIPFHKWALLLDRENAETIGL